MLRRQITKNMSPELTSALRAVQRELHVIDDARKVELGRLSAEYTRTAHDVGWRMGVKEPEHVTIEPRYLNGWAWKESKGSRNRISLNIATARALPEDAREYLMGHELWHIKKWDRSAPSLSNMLSKELSYLTATFIVVVGNITEAPWNAASAFGIIEKETMLVTLGVGARQVIRKASTPALLVMHRHEEKRADLNSVKASGLTGMLMMHGLNDGIAVKTLDRLLDGKAPEGEQKNTTSLWKKLKSTYRQLMHDTHPKSEKRVEYAIRYAKRHGIEG